MAVEVFFCVKTETKFNPKGLGVYYHGSRNLSQKKNEI